MFSREKLDFSLIKTAEYEKLGKEVKGTIPFENLAWEVSEQHYLKRSDFLTLYVSPASTAESCVTCTHKN